MHFIHTALQIPQRRNDFNNLETIFFVMAVNILGVYFSLTTTMINFISTVQQEEKKREEKKKKMKKNEENEENEENYS